MIYKNKFLLLAFFLIIIFQTILYTNNNQKTSFRYFDWNVRDVSVGNLISISFFSGLFISTLLNTTVISYKKNTFENLEENFEPQNNEEDIQTYIEMPPQRDIRDAQPTISVNYRIVKNNDEYNSRRDENYSNISDNKDDWHNVDNDW